MNLLVIVKKMFIKTTFLKRPKMSYGANKLLTIRTIVSVRIYNLVKKLRQAILQVQVEATYSPGPHLGHPFLRAELRQLYCVLTCPNNPRTGPPELQG